MLTPCVDIWSLLSGKWSHLLKKNQFLQVFLMASCAHTELGAALLSTADLMESAGCSL